MHMSEKNALHDCYKGQSNVAHAAKSIGMSLADFQRGFRNYVSKTPVDPDPWQGRR